MSAKDFKVNKWKLKTEYYWFVLFAATFIVYQLVQDYWRPGYKGDNTLIKYLLGIAPNFFPAIGIPALFVLIIPELGKKNNASKWLTTHRHLSANIVSLVCLLAWEFMQISTARGRFDWNDVLWTFIGAAFFHIIWSIAPEQWKHKELCDTPIKTKTDQSLQHVYTPRKN